MFKKIFSIFLVCLIVLSLSVPFAFAAPPSGVLFPDGLTWDDDIILWQDNSSGKYVLFHHITGCLVRNNRVYFDITECENRIYYVSDDLQTWKTRVDFSVNITVDGREYLRNDLTPESNLTVLYSSIMLYTTTGAVFAYPSTTPTLPVEPLNSSYALFYGSDNYLYFYDNYAPYDDRVDLVDDMYIITYTVDVAPDVYRYKDGVWESVNIASGVGYLNITGASAIYHYPNRLTFEGSDFFIPPLTLAAAIQGGLESLMITIMKAVLILVSLGVFLMASLIGLNLLKRLLLGFLN